MVHSCKPLFITAGVIHLCVPHHILQVDPNPRTVFGCGEAVTGYENGGKGKSKKSGNFKEKRVLNISKGQEGVIGEV